MVKLFCLHAWPASTRERLSYYFHRYEFKEHIDDKVRHIFITLTILMAAYISACLNMQATLTGQEKLDIVKGADYALHMVYKFEVFELHYKRFHLDILLGVSPQLITKDFSEELQTGEILSVYLNLEDTFIYGWFGSPMSEREKEILARERMQRALNRSRKKTWIILPKPPPWPSPTLASREELLVLEEKE
ncbi:MAG: hypothetical protein GXP49_04990 [Deltaproteobacteria bacterium]|nr:hypothetical protein [Deltaproteobacteria bacterium]